MVFLDHSVSSEVGIYVELIVDVLIIGQQEIQVGFLEIYLIFPILSVWEAVAWNRLFLWFYIPRRNRAPHAP